MLSKVLPAVQGTCSLLAAKLSYSKHEGMSCDDLWLNICQKRDECDEKIKPMYDESDWSDKCHQLNPFSVK